MSALVATGISFTPRGASAPVLKAVDFRLDGGEMVGLIGPNGAGKTTLLRLLAGLVAPDSGAVRLDDRLLHAYPPAARARRLAYLPQDGGSSWAVPVETLVMMGRLPYRRVWSGPSAADRRAVAEAIAACDLAALAGRAVTTLSGGERARVMLARALAGEPGFLLADEPVAGLDPGHRLDVMERLRMRAATGAGIVVVMHDLTLATRFCHRLALLHDGAIVAEGRPEAVLSADNLARCYGVSAYRGAAGGAAVIVPVARVARDRTMHNTARVARDRIMHNTARVARDPDHV